MSKFIKVDELQQKIKNDPRIVEDNTGYYDDVILVDDINDIIKKCKQYEFDEPCTAEWKKVGECNV